MNIDWIAFAPGDALAGGVLIGLSTLAFALLLGRVAGISGIVGGLLPPRRGDAAWRITFVAGLLSAPLAWWLVAPLPVPTIEAGPLELVLAGLLVGYGTRLGSGCTSGHGVCGLSRGSVRSVAATLAFMAAGFVTVWLLRHGVGA